MNKSCATCRHEEEENKDYCLVCNGAEYWDESAEAKAQRLEQYCAELVKRERKLRKKNRHLIILGRKIKPAK